MFRTKTELLLNVKHCGEADLIRSFSLEVKNNPLNVHRVKTSGDIDEMINSLRNVPSAILNDAYEKTFLDEADTSADTDEEGFDLENESEAEDEDEEVDDEDEDDDEDHDEDGDEDKDVDEEDEDQDQDEEEEEEEEEDDEKEEG